MAKKLSTDAEGRAMRRIVKALNSRAKLPADREKLSFSIEKARHDKMQEVLRLFLDLIEATFREKTGNDMRAMREIVEAIYIQRNMRRWTRMLKGLPTKSIGHGDGELVTALLFHPERENLRPPCLTCGQWYLSNSARKSRFCSRACFDKRKLIERRNSARAEKLARIRKALEKYPGRPKKCRDLSWKSWVAHFEPDVTANFLTHALNKGELSEPSF
jgi:hypothetical protein